MGIFGFIRPLLILTLAALVTVYCVLKWNNEDDLPSFHQQEDNLTYCDFTNALYRNMAICGKPFSPAWLPYLQRLGLTEQQISQISKEDDEWILKKHPVFITAFDDSHCHVAISHMFKTFAQYHPSEKMVVYDLGLSKENRQKLLNLQSVHSIRQFNYSTYPPHVKRMKEYRWKPLLIAEALQEFRAVLYSDAHMVWTAEQNLTDLLNKIHCQTKGCDYYANLLLGDTGHSIYSTTDKRVYEYFPIPPDNSKRIEMGIALIQLTYYTSDVRSNLYKWAVLCALEENCMGPTGTTTQCRFGKNRWDTYANCHRYDQSVYNILLANRNQYSRHRYVLPFSNKRT